jgi:hypothetical protein
MELLLDGHWRGSGISCRCGIDAQKALFGGCGLRVAGHGFVHRFLFVVGEVMDLGPRLKLYRIRYKFVFDDLLKKGGS